jgi:glutaredoxin-related protein
MSRPLLQQYSPVATTAIAGFHAEVVRQVSDAVSNNKVVVVGMAWNPFCKRATKALDAAGIQYTYLEYGNYLSAWKERLAIKMWSGWPTFPQVFVNGSLIGGCTDLQSAIADGTLKTMIG